MKPHYVACSHPDHEGEYKYNMAENATTQAPLLYTYVGKCTKFATNYFSDLPLYRMDQFIRMMQEH